METPSATSGLNGVCVGAVLQQQPAAWWRPWNGLDSERVTLQNSTCGDHCDAKHTKTPQVVHPVKLFWPKSRCFDYLYQDAERLLRSYPVQATISPYQEPSSDEDSDEEEEEEEEEAVVKELN